MNTRVQACEHRIFSPRPCLSRVVLVRGSTSASLPRSSTARSTLSPRVTSGQAASTGVVGSLAIRAPNSHGRANVHDPPLPGAELVRHGAVRHRCQPEPAQVLRRVAVSVEHRPTGRAHPRLLAERESVNRHGSQTIQFAGDGTATWPWRSAEPSAARSVFQSARKSRATPEWSGHSSSRGGSGRRGARTIPMTSTRYSRPQGSRPSLGSRAVSPSRLANLA